MCFFMYITLPLFATILRAFNSLTYWAIQLLKGQPRDLKSIVGSFPFPLGGGGEYSTMYSRYFIKSKLSNNSIKFILQINIVLARFQIVVNISQLSHTVVITILAKPGDTYLKQLRLPLPDWCSV